jgi:crotonobetainyl-CoA:carnitine CoA-transferase CaiB-like acyl-CoA transferase
MMYVPFASFLANGAQPERGNGGLSGRYACYQIYETKDGRFLSLGALEHKFWENACRTLGREDFIGKCYDDGAQEGIIAAFRELFITRTAAEWLAAFEHVDTCVALVNDIAEMIEDPQIKHRGLIAEIEHPTEGRLKQIAPTVKLSTTPGAVMSPPPRLGEHTREILKSLDYADETIESLTREGVVSI